MRRPLGCCDPLDAATGWVRGGNRITTVDKQIDTRYNALNDLKDLGLPDKHEEARCSATVSTAEQY